MNKKCDGEKKFSVKTHLSQNQFFLFVKNSSGSKNFDLTTVVWRIPRYLWFVGVTYEVVEQQQNETQHVTFSKNKESPEGYGFVPSWKNEKRKIDRSVDRLVDRSRDR